MTLRVVELPGVGSSKMPLFATAGVDVLPIQDWTIDVTFTTMNDPFIVDGTVNEVGVLRHSGTLFPVIVLELHGPANSQMLTLPGLPPLSTNRVRVAF
jgi:hypothetical protein